MKGKVPAIQVDAGNFFASPPKKEMADSPSIRATNEWALRAAEKAGLVAINVSPYDVSFLSRAMAADGHAKRVEELPALERVVSANVVPASERVKPFKPFVVVEVAGERVGAKPIRVGFLGVSEVPREGASGAGYTIGDPVEAVRKHLPALREQADLVVVLAYANQNLVGEIESAARGVDAIVSAHRIAKVKTTGESERPVYLAVSDQGKFLSELRVYVEDGRPVRFVRHAVSLGPEVPEDLPMAQVVNQLRLAALDAGK